MSEYFEFDSLRKSHQQCFEFITLNKSCLTKTNFDDEQQRKSALNKLREKIGSSIDYALKDKSCLYDEDFLNRFLFARKFDSDLAYNLLINYFQYKERYKDTLLKKLNIYDPKIQLAIREGCPYILKERDRKGRKILAFFASNWSTSFLLEDIYRALLLSLEKLLEDRQNQSCGFVAIVDWTNVTFKQSSQLNPLILKIIANGLQDSFPVRFKAVHFVGQPWYIEIAFTAMKPFLTEKNWDRIKFHSRNFFSLHNYFPKDVLPAELGGEAIHLNSTDWLNQLIESNKDDIKSHKSYKLVDNIGLLPNFDNNTV
ncbi:clavesin-1-like [Condylostylus longicornis]|uniref:clavesin-1-like n=1 Tax=Condylostylus longicornis TaxID=2530218 RepID=UPI00244DB57D|nr:clavesin-1-like [Condylostylus longicornis]